ncbi:MAG TPA: hypothetical protein VJ739_10245 [Gemmataceae bacterium]|nr:hypothetical protein [Gemmataceae bacterium]
MAERDPYEAWKRRRAEVVVHDEFADRVMASLRGRERRRAGVLRRLLASPAFRVGVCSLACAAGLFRVLQVVALFLVEQPSR